MHIKNKIKMLAASRGVTLKKLAERLSELSGEEYTYNSLLGKLNRESLSLKEAFFIAQILDYKLDFIDNFKNDITRIKSNPKNFYRRAYGNEKDRILFYSKNSQKNIWKDLRIPLEDSEIKEKFTKIDDKGRRYTTIPLHAPGETKNGITGKPWRNIPVPEGRHWRTDPAEFDKLDKQGDIEWSLNGNPRIKKYADEHKGKRIQDIWKFKDPQKPIYPTEKNMEMLKRIILQSSDENSIVLDCFAGSGTTLECANKLGRKWIGVDNSDVAIDKIKNRQIGEYQFIDITKVNKINTKQKIHSYEVKIGNMVNVQ